MHSATAPSVPVNMLHLIVHQRENRARHGWPVTLATQEAEIRRIMVQRQPGQIVRETLSQKYPSQKSAGAVAHVILLLPSKHEALSSNFSTTKRQKKEENRCDSSRTALALQA
jgi:hypothetical protein